MVAYEGLVESSIRKLCTHETVHVVPWIENYHPSDPEDTSSLRAVWFCGIDTGTYIYRNNPLVNMHSTYL